MSRNPGSWELPLARATLTFEDAPTQEVVEQWSRANNLDAQKLLVMHFEMRFKAKRLHLERASVEGPSLLFFVVTDRWSASREFALTNEGSLMW